MDNATWTAKISQALALAALALSSAAAGPVAVKTASPRWQQALKGYTLHLQTELKLEGKLDAAQLGTLSHFLKEEIKREMHVVGDAGDEQLAVAFARRTVGEDEPADASARLMTQSEVDDLVRAHEWGRARVDKALAALRTEARNVRSRLVLRAQHADSAAEFKEAMLGLDAAVRGFGPFMGKPWSASTAREAGRAASRFVERFGEETAAKLFDRGFYSDFGGVGGWASSNEAAVATDAATLRPTSKITLPLSKPSGAQARAPMSAADAQAPASTARAAANAPGSWDLDGNVYVDQAGELSLQAGDGYVSILRSETPILDVYRHEGRLYVRRAEDILVQTEDGGGFVPALRGRGPISKSGWRETYMGEYHYAIAGASLLIEVPGEWGELFRAEDGENIQRFDTLEGGVLRVVTDRRVVVQKGLKLTFHF